MKIFEIRTYEGENGVIIQSKTDMFGSGRIFRATAMVPMEVRDVAGVVSARPADDKTPPGAEVPNVNFAFEVPGRNTEEAFAAFHEAFEAAKTKAAADVCRQIEGQRRRIVVPPAGMKIHDPGK